MTDQPITTREPVTATATITAAVTAGLALLVAFGVPLTDAQQVAILGVAAVAAPLVVAVSRRWVVPSAAVVERIEDQDGREVVVAGEGSELATGEVIRDAGSLDYQPTHRAATPITEADVVELMRDDRTA